MAKSHTTEGARAQALQTIRLLTAAAEGDTADVYLRVGRGRGWGQQEHWTHIDGYQVMRGGRVRALVGGDVRYGGLLDLCSISSADQREGVMARFAVVYRERFLVR